MAGVPKFGNWENDGTVMYTQYFEGARNGKGGAKPTKEGNGSVSTNVLPVQAMPAKTRASLHLAQAADSSAPYENASRKTVGGDSGKAAGDSQLRAHRMGTRPDRSAENSHLGQHTSERFNNKSGSASPWQIRGQSDRNHDFGLTIPGRSRSQQSDQTTEKVATVPKFGEWDESDPAGSAGYTEVFRIVGEEKRNPSRKDPYIINEPAYTEPSFRPTSGSWLSCFRWK